MKGKAGVLCAVLAGSVLLLSGCSFTGTMKDLVDDTAEVSSSETGALQTAEGTKVDALPIDVSLERPVFREELVSTQNVQLGAETVLQTEATVSGGGSVTYQWYSNNVASNGGGTLLKDATSPTYVADTSKGGKTFYYVVATNTQDGRINLATSPVYEVTVWEDMYWQQNAELGAYQYMSRVDGKYPSLVSMTIDGKEYSFDANGFAIMEDGSYLDVQTGEAVATPTPEPTPAATPEPTPEPETEDAGDTE